MLPNGILHPIIVTNSSAILVSGSRTPNASAATMSSNPNAALLRIMQTTSFASIGVQGEIGAVLSVRVQPCARSVANPKPKPNSAVPNKANIPKFAMR
jgi:hypothetical protein